MVLQLPFKVPGSEPKSYELSESARLPRLPALFGIDLRATPGTNTVPVDVALFAGLALAIAAVFAGGLVAPIRRRGLAGRLAFAGIVGGVGYGLLAALGGRAVPLAIPATNLNPAFLIALGAAVFVWLFLFRTRFGYDLRAAGLSPKAAEYGGASLARNTVLAMAISGALAGLTATHYVLGGALEDYALRQSIPTSDGFDGIAVALLGNNHPVGVVFAAFLFGVLKNGGSVLNITFSDLTRDVVSMVLALVVLFIAAKGFLPDRWTNPLRRAQALGAAGLPPPPEAGPDPAAPPRAPPRGRAAGGGRAGAGPGRGGRALMETVVLLTLFASALRATTPLLFAALGGLFSERSGIVNIALEGIMIFGALAAALVTYYVELPVLRANPGAVVWYAPWVGLLAAMVMGGLVGLLHAVISIRYKADQIISGVAINLMAIGLPAVLLTGLFGNSTTSATISNRLPRWGEGVFTFSPLVFIAFALVPVVWFVVFRTPFGLRLRAVGEHPARRRQRRDLGHPHALRGRDALGRARGARRGLPLDRRLQPVHRRDVRRARLHRAGGADLRQVAPARRARRDAAVRRLPGARDAARRRPAAAAHGGPEPALHPDHARLGRLRRPLGRPQGHREALRERLTPCPSPAAPASCSTPRRSPDRTAWASWARTRCAGWTCSPRPGQRVWQVLPLGPTGYGDSPYQSFSSFAGNPYLISLERLRDEGWLTYDDLAGGDVDPGRIDFGPVISFRLDALGRAAARLVRARRRGRARRVRRLPGARGRPGSTTSRCSWRSRRRTGAGRGPSGRRRSATASRRRSPTARVDARRGDRAPRPLAVLVRCATGAPCAPAPPSSTSRSWATCRSSSPTIRPTPGPTSSSSTSTTTGQPTVIAGVPPDYFSATGQRWGNPLYRWKRHADTGYAWWVQRVRRTLELVDVLRIDHFRGFEAFWEIPASEPTAVKGRWVKGPGQPLFDALRAALGELPIVAEDLGVITAGVEKLRDDNALPGMKVLQFAFAADASDPYLPHNYPSNSVVYTGTHDNDTTAGWYAQAPEKERDLVRRYLARDDTNVALGAVAARPGIGRRHRDRAAPGPARAGARGAHERAGRRLGQLGLALHVGRRPGVVGAPAARDGGALRPRRRGGAVDTPYRQSTTGGEAEG